MLTMQKELSAVLEGISNINDVAKFSLQLEFLSYTVQRHKELRELCHEEFVRRMENAMYRRRMLQKRRQMRQKMNSVNEQGKNNEMQVSVVSLSKLDTGAAESNIRKPLDTHKTLLPDNINPDSQKKQTKTADSERSRVSPGHSRGRKRGSLSNSNQGNKPTGKGRRNFRRLSLAIGGVVRISTRRRNTHPDDTGLYIGRKGLGKNQTKTGAKKGIVGDERSANSYHVNRAEPHLAVTRQMMDTTAREMITRVKVIKSFQGK